MDRPKQQDALNSPDHIWGVIGQIEKNQERISTILDGVAGRIGSLETKIGEAVKFPWGAFSAVASVVLFVIGGFSWFLFYTYSESLSAVREDIKQVSGYTTERFHRVEARMDEIVPRKEHEVRWEDRRRELDYLFSRMKQLEDNRRTY